MPVKTPRTMYSRRESCSEPWARGAKGVLGPGVEFSAWLESVLRFLNPSPRMLNESAPPERAATVLESKVWIRLKLVELIAVISAPDHQQTR